MAVFVLTLDAFFSGGVDDYVNESCHWDISAAPEMSAIKMASKYDTNVFKTTDVIADSRNVKQLLKIEHSNSEISMAVHRIGRSLLVDEFPLTNNSFVNSKSKKNKRRNRPAMNSHSNLVSKFLYHTMLKNNYLTFSNPSKDLVLRKRSASQSDIIVGMGDPLPRLEIDLPTANNTTGDNLYNRTVFWNFKDIAMLLGNNMPIFGGGEYPAISLKLRDMREPINILTGIDCWLDNLICNVPELSMCWHLDGFVQSYEMYKTEDIPDLSDSKFSPIVIQNLASNILKFLQANAVKEGNTYWLYKAKGDDIVKLYDLSSICKGSNVNANETNPFSVPVAMLCFKVAQKLYEEGNAANRSTIYTLLKNCLPLIPVNSYHQMRATCHFIISDMFLSSNFDVSKDNKVILKAMPLYECRFNNVHDVCVCKAQLLDPDWEPSEVHYCWYDIANDLKKQKTIALEHIISGNSIRHQKQIESLYVLYSFIRY